MYNRYVPRPDGSYSRNRMPDSPLPANNFPPQRPLQEKAPPVQAQEQTDFTQIRSSNFLQQLLPKDFDTGDLFVIFLLLLMAGDSPEGKNNAILTLALYFLM